MALKKEKKNELLEQYTTMFSNARIAVVAGYQGLTVSDMQKLRAGMRDVGAEVHVVKNTLARLALQELGVDMPEELWTEANAVGVTTEDAVAAAKSLVDYAKGDERFRIKAAFLGMQPITADQVTRLAELPPREVLLAQVLSGMQAPITGVVMALGGIVRGLMNVLNARAEQLEGSPAQG